MASITDQPNGRRTIQFYAAGGVRRSIRLGKVSRKHAEAVRLRVEDLLNAQGTNQAMSRQTAVWLQDLDSVMWDKLARVGLVEPRVSAELGPFVESYMASRTDVKESTHKTYQRCRNHLVEYFGADRLLDSITAGDGDEWFRWMIGPRKLAPNTARKSVCNAKQFFAAAIRKHLLETNPLAHLSGTVGANRSRDYHVTLEEAQRVLDACPDAEWRLLFALARFGGLRVPSEVLRLRWADVDWEGEWFTVHASKTAHHDDGGIRRVPLFSVLKPYLLDAFELALPGADRVITRYRENTANLGTQAHRIIRRAGLEPWPKTFQNLRATRETELADRFPEHVVTRWIGNSVGVARKHYLQETESHHRQAIEATEKAVRKAVRYPVRQVNVEQRTTSHDGERQVSQAVLDSDLSETMPCCTALFHSLQNANQWAIQDSNL